ncbi:IS1595 family transposase [Herminiimonas fonticola]|uniref:Transposase-like protein n=1 Tax=Herminiimonas fonticola TaxID=303380 RepID=A0A4R6GID3_9BURK|nr:IS1595 family transposase [Herminiimonas fonticola]RBA25494.1 ISXO2-like transposase domain [Herminiimonas fonticola]TDN94607.1 transposase-like protein [Herminiimonas fonticola]
MAQHFLLSAASRDLCAYDIAGWSEEDAFWFFVEQRWGNRNTQTCPSCGVVDAHYFRSKRLQWRCRHCDRSFSVTSGTPFDSRKMPFRKMMLGISLYLSGAKGKSAIQLAREINVNVKTAFVFIGKLRECLLRNRSVEKLCGQVQIDGGHFGGKPRKKNFRNRPDHAAIANKVEGILNPSIKKQGKKRHYAYSKENVERRKKRRIVMVLREIYPEEKRGARRTIVSIAMSENERDAIELAHRYIDPDAYIWTDENTAYGQLSAWWEHEAVSHSEMFYRPDGVNENQAESYFSRLRRCEYGVVHRITPKYLMDLSNDMAWREDVRRLSEGEKMKELFSKIMKNGLSRWWRGYFQGHHREGEFLML